MSTDDDTLALAARVTALLDRLGVPRIQRIERPGPGDVELPEPVDGAVLSYSYPFIQYQHRPVLSRLLAPEGTTIILGSAGEQTHTEGNCITPDRADMCGRCYVQLTGFVERTPQGVLLRRWVSTALFGTWLIIHLSERPVDAFKP